MLPDGRKFRPGTAVSRADLAEAVLRSGRVSQYVSASPMFTDVRDPWTRNAVESVQSDLDGRLFFDAVPGGRFYPYLSASRLVTAVALVRAAGLSTAAAGATLSSGIADASAVPAEWRGYVAVALQRGFLSLNGNRIDPSRAVTRIELASAMNKLIE
jgi:hypothetical protein